MIMLGNAPETIARFKKVFPRVRFMGDSSDRYVRNKYNTNSLFKSEDLKKYRPQCITCPKMYDEKLAQTIIEAMDCDLYVLKPVNACRGRGIIFVTKEELDTTLQEVFTNADAYEERGRMHVLEPTNECFGRSVVWVHPAFANRCCFVRNDKELVCVSLSASNDHN